MRRQATITILSSRKWWNDTRNGSFHHPRASVARPGDLVQQDVDGIGSRALAAFRIKMRRKSDISDLRDFRRKDGASPLSPGHDGVTGCVSLANSDTGA